MADIEDFKRALQTMQNIKEGEKIERFKFTATESTALDFVIEYMQKSIDEK